MELADLFLVTKADGELAAAAARAAAEYRGALQFLRPPSPAWRPPVLKCSALTGAGVAEVWETVGRFQNAIAADGALAAKRADQARAWMWSEVSESLLASLRNHSGVQRLLPGLESEVRAGRITPAAAARRLLAAFQGADTDDPP